jgi:uncharacterized RDD family membrane protein YckC
MNEQNLKRCAALCIDFFLISIAYTVCINLIPGTLLSHEALGLQWTFGLAPDWYLTLAALYFVSCDLFLLGESLGKDIMGLQTNGPEGGVMPVPMRLYRTLLKLVSLIFLPLAALAFFWKEKGLTLQDYLTGSSVTLRRGIKGSP